MNSIENLYCRLQDPIDKFVVAFVFELGYTQSVTANCLDVSSAAVCKRIKKIKKKLKKKYRGL